MPYIAQVEHLVRVTRVAVMQQVWCSLEAALNDDATMHASRCVPGIPHALRKPSLAFLGGTWTQKNLAHTTVVSRRWQWQSWSLSFSLSLFLKCWDNVARTNFLFIFPCLHIYLTILPDICTGHRCSADGLHVGIVCDKSNRPSGQSRLGIDRCSCADPIV